MLVVQFSEKNCFQHQEVYFCPETYEVFETLPSLTRHVLELAPFQKKITDNDYNDDNDDHDADDDDDNEDDNRDNKNNSYY